MIKENEIYVHDKFTGQTPYKLIEKMVYEQFKAYLYQIKGEEKRDAIEVYPNHNGIIELAQIYPLVSKKQLLFIG